MEFRSILQEKKLLHCHLSSFTCFRKPTNYGPERMHFHFAINHASICSIRFAVPIKSESNSQSPSRSVQSLESGQMIFLHSGRKQKNISFIEIYLPSISDQHLPYSFQVHGHEPEIHRLPFLYDKSSHVSCVSCVWAI